MLPLDGLVAKPVPSYRIGTPKDCQAPRKPVSRVARPSINEAPWVVATPPATRPFGRRSPTARHRTRRRTRGDRPSTPPPRPGARRGRYGVRAVIDPPARSLPPSAKTGGSYQADEPPSKGRHNDVANKYQRHQYRPPKAAAEAVRWSCHVRDCADRGCESHFRCLPENRYLARYIGKQVACVLLQRAKYVSFNAKFDTPGLRCGAVSQCAFSPSTGRRDPRSTGFLRAG
jgi:hypothetical protein